MIALVLFGAIGLSLRVRPWIAPLVGVGAGLFVLAMGARFLGAGGLAARRESFLGRPTGALVAVWRRYVSVARSPGIVVLGVVHGFLPCPLLYVMFGARPAVGGDASPRIVSSVRLGSDGLGPGPGGPRPPGAWHVLTSVKPAPSP
ncbi:MAG: sulfite exporter TauE/SafE family protein [Candidatus Rokubacteria bacterium]|nr:sulfite exporter TauE/SafE family protein [Candidatus Rokubacteria bacterium]